jgi:hypothetical protein
MSDDVVLERQGAGQPLVASGIIVTAYKGGRELVIFKIKQKKPCLFYTLCAFKKTVDRTKNKARFTFCQPVNLLTERDVKMLCVLLLVL